jgi:hypothetical protein
LRRNQMPRRSDWLALLGLVALAAMLLLVW